MNNLEEKTAVSDWENENEWKSNSENENEDENIELSENEVEIKNYYCSTLTFPRCEGHVKVTNKRVIFHGSSYKGRVVDEVKLDTISAVSSMYGTKIKAGLLILGTILTIASFFTIKLNFMVFLTILAIGIICLYFSYRKIFALQIFSSGANGAPIAIGEGVANSPFAQNSTSTIIAKPTNETDKMMLELGALILDLQTMGDLAIEKWKK